MMMMTRRASFVAALSSARYAMVRDLVRSFAISFVRRRARASRVDGMRTDVRLDGWIGGRRMMMMMMMNDDDRALDEDGGDGENARTKD